MNTTSLHITIEPRTKEELKKRLTRLSLSAVMKALLKQFIRTKRLSVGITETPNAYLRKSLQESEEDIRAGRVPSFGSAKDALKYLDKETADEKRAAH